MTINSCFEEEFERFAYNADFDVSGAKDIVKPLIKYIISLEHEKNVLQNRLNDCEEALKEAYKDDEEIVDSILNWVRKKRYKDAFLVTED